MTGAAALKTLTGPRVDTRTSQRRQMRIASWQDLTSEIDRIERASKPDGEGLRVTGNWSAGQIMVHMARAIERSLDGFSGAPESERHLPDGFARIRASRERARVMARERETKVVLLGVHAPAGPSVALPGELAPPALVWTPDGAAWLRVALKRVLDGHPMDKPSPTAGRLSPEEWARFHIAHAALHLSFIVLGEWV